MAVILTGSEYIDLDAVAANLDVRSRPLTWYVEFQSSETASIMFLLAHGRNSAAGTQEYAQLWIGDSQSRSRWNGSVQGQVEVQNGLTNDGTPHSMATVVRSSADSMTVFLDGASDTSEGAIGENLTTADIADNMAIGRDSDVDQFYYIGEVANVAVWEVELSDADLTDLTAGTVAPLDLPSGLLGFWPLDFDARDASGNGNHGTLVGDPEFTEDAPLTALPGSSLSPGQVASFDFTAALSVEAQPGLVSTAEQTAVFTGVEQAASVTRCIQPVAAVRAAALVGAARGVQPVADVRTAQPTWEPDCV